MNTGSYAGIEKKRGKERGGWKQQDEAKLMEKMGKILHTWIKIWIKNTEKELAMGKPCHLRQKESPAKRAGRQSELISVSYKLK